MNRNLLRMLFSISRITVVRIINNSDEEMMFSSSKLGSFFSRNYKSFDKAKNKLFDAGNCSFARRDTVPLLTGCEAIRLPP